MYFVWFLDCWVLYSWGWSFVRKINRSWVLLGVTLRAVRQVRLHTESPELLQWILTLIMRRPAGLMAKKQTGQSKVLGDGAGPACPAGCDAQTALLRSSWVLMKMNNRASTADCAASGSRSEAAHLDCLITSLTREGVWLIIGQLSYWYGLQYQCEFEELLIPFTVELCWEILCKYLVDLLITNYRMRVIFSLPC